MNYWSEVLSDLPQSYQNWFIEEKNYLQEKIFKDAKVLEV